jgi:hypothetical protein
MKRFIRSFERNARNGDGHFAIAYAILMACDCLDRKGATRAKTGALGEIADEVWRVRRLAEVVFEYYQIVQRSNS